VPHLRRKTAHRLGGQRALHHGRCIFGHQATQRHGGAVRRVGLPGAAQAEIHRAVQLANLGGEKMKMKENKLNQNDYSKPEQQRKNPLHALTQPSPAKIPSKHANKFCPIDSNRTHLFEESVHFNEQTEERVAELMTPRSSGQEVQQVHHLW